MTPHEQISEYINIQPEAKRNDLWELHHLMQELIPDAKLWFLDGRNSDGKTVSNPNIGYGLYTLHYADGKTKEFYQIGLSANTTGISVYIMGVDDKTYLTRTFGEEIGKATITGYCIKFKALKEINIEVLKAAIQYGYKQNS